MAVGEIVLTAFVQLLFDKLASADLWYFPRTDRIHTMLKKWTRMLDQIKAVLADAEEKQMTDQSGGIKHWLEDLEDLTYDLDDLVDEFNTEALRRNVMEQPQASTSMVHALLPTWCTSFNPRTLLSGFQMSSQINEITDRLQDLFDRRTGLGLEILAAGPFAQAPQRPPSSSLIHEPRLYGRDGDEKKIIELLLSDQLSNGDVDVVPIVGMGGVGKTTLAQMVYNSEPVEKHFEMKAWVCVSEVFDIVGVTKAILESVTSQSCDFKTLDKVQVELKKDLAGKKFLIVLDDVWNKNHGDWSRLKSPFNVGAPGSKVIVTTRNTDVALMMAETNKFHSLKELSEDDCWSVFAQHAFGNKSIDQRPNLILIGRRIVKKCRGLPLAARTLGGLLRCKLRDDEWDEVLNSKIWDLPIEESDILPALRLSYYHLPAHLKKCFAYCSVLPKDYEFEEKELVFLWMAEGLIQKPTGQKQIEDVGSKYFRELLSRSFFQQSSGKVTLFVMHDLVNDLAQFIARRICFRLEDKLQDNAEGEIFAQARHSSYTRGYRDGIKRFEAFRNAKNLRTFLPLELGAHSSLDSYLTSYVPLHLLPSLRRLRVLSLRRYQIGELSDLIGNLKHMRYLDLSHALIVMLPESIGNLYNLQTLILRDCRKLEKLPANTGNLINLRHLDITGANSLEEMPPKMGKLTSLQTLSNFIVSKGDGSTISELGNLNHLSGTVCISRLENVMDAEDARKAKLKDKEGLDVLLMEWGNISDDSSNGSVDISDDSSDESVDISDDSSDGSVDISDDSRDGSVESNVLDMLKPHKNIKELTLNGYHGLTFPTWIGNSSFSNIICLQLYNCVNCSSLPPLGQLPSLVKLFILGMKVVENLGLEFCGLRCSNPFPSLEILSFEDMPEWKDWSPFGVEEGTQPFARLSKLSIKKCPKLLGKFPSNLPCLKELVIEECPMLVVAWVPSHIELNEMWNALHFDSLISLSLQDVSIPNSFRNPEDGEEAVLGNARFSHLSSLTSLRIENIQGLTCLPSWFFKQLTGLQELSLSGCEEFRSLWKNEIRQQNRLPSLKRLVVERCSQLISLFEEDEEDEVEGLQQHDEVPCMMMLEYLEISQCGKLEKLPRGLHNHKSLQRILISDCPCLISFPKTCLPSTLRELSIWSCDGLRSLPELTMLNSLEELDIEKCPSLTYLISTGTGLLPTLKKLTIVDCGKLEAILGEEGTEINFPILESVFIDNCESLKSFPSALLNNGGCLGNLTNLRITRCDNLEAPSLRAYNNLTSLQWVVLDSCATGTELLSCILKEESSLSSSYFTNLTYLELDNVDVGKPPSEWGLHRLSSLRHLTLQSYGWASFSENGMLWLPPSLIELTIQNFPNLKKLSCKEFQNLPSLKFLWIWNCTKLTSITGLGQLSSLLKLSIWECPILLPSFAEQRLPTSLLEFFISKAPIGWRIILKGISYGGVIK